MTCTLLSYVEDYIVLSFPTVKVSIKPVSHTDLSKWKDVLSSWVSYLRQVPLFRVVDGGTSLDLFHSWGYKKSRAEGGAFHRFYFWLKDGMLQYFNDEEDVEEPLGYALVSSVTFVSDPVRDRDFFAFRVHLNENTVWTLGFDNKKLAEDWRLRIAPVLPSEKKRGFTVLSSVRGALKTLRVAGSSGHDSSSSVESAATVSTSPPSSAAPRVWVPQPRRAPPESMADADETTVTMELPQMGLVDGGEDWFSNTAGAPVEVIVSRTGTVASVDKASEGGDPPPPHGRERSVTTRLREILSSYDGEQGPVGATTLHTEEVEKLSEDLGEVMAWRAQSLESGDDDYTEQSEDLERLRQRLEQMSFYLGDSSSSVIAQDAIAKAILRHTFGSSRSGSSKHSSVQSGGGDAQGSVAARTYAAKLLLDGLGKLEEAAPVIPPKPKGLAPKKAVASPPPKGGVVGEPLRSGGKPMFIAAAAPPEARGSGGGSGSISPRTRSPARNQRLLKEESEENLVVVAAIPPPASSSAAVRNARNPRARKDEKVQEEETVVTTTRAAGVSPRTLGRTYDEADDNAAPALSSSARSMRRSPRIRRDERQEVEQDEGDDEAAYFGAALPPPTTTTGTSGRTASPTKEQQQQQQASRGRLGASGTRIPIGTKTTGRGVSARVYVAETPPDATLDDMDTGDMEYRKDVSEFLSAVQRDDQWK